MNDSKERKGNIIRNLQINFLVEDLIPSLSSPKELYPISQISTNVIDKSNRPQKIEELEISSIQSNNY